MKTIALISSVILTGLLLVHTSQAAPSCCAPAQEQGTAGALSPAPVGQPFNLPVGNYRQDAGSATTFPVTQRNAYMPPAPQTHREVAPGPRDAKQSHAAPAYYPTPVAPIQTISVMSPTAPVAVAPGGCGCGRFNTVAYQEPGGSCCKGRGLNVPEQAATPSGSTPSCCGVQFKSAAPAPNCCAGKVKAAAPVPSCCAGKVDAASPVPNCCAVGPKTAAPARQVTQSARKAPNSHSPLQAQPTVVPAGFPSSMASAMKILSGGEPTLRFGSLW